MSTVCTRGKPALTEPLCTGGFGSIVACREGLPPARSGRRADASIRLCAEPTINQVGADIIQALNIRVTRMNRQKKIKQLLKAHAKKASAKLAPKNKPKYISKADRLKLADESSDDSNTPSE